MSHPESGTTAHVSPSGNRLTVRPATGPTRSYWWPDLPEQARAFHQSAFAFCRLLAASTPRVIYFGAQHCGSTISVEFERVENSSRDAYLSD